MERENLAMAHQPSPRPDEIGTHEHRQVEGPLGFRQPETAARALEKILARQPTGAEFAYRRWAVPADAVEFIPGERAEISVISSAALDRDKEVVLPEGLQMEQFRRNPVVVWAHDYRELPIGMAQWIRLDRGRGVIKAKTCYAPRPPEWVGPWKADAVWELVRQGLLKGKSIGFLPLEGGRPNSEELRSRPDLAAAQWIHRKALLLEYSVVPIPSNAEALVESIAKSLGNALAVLGQPLDPSRSSALSTVACSVRTLAAESGRLDARMPAMTTPQQVVALSTWHQVFRDTLRAALQGVPWTELMAQRLASRQGAV